jgi:hypothetical protein
MLTIAMAKNPVFHARSKHIEFRHHLIWDMVSKEEIRLEFIDINSSSFLSLWRLHNFIGFAQIDQVNWN